jgi:uncharacterized protein YgiM (DUF1202 family)
MKDKNKMARNIWSTLPGCLLLVLIVAACSPQSSTEFAVEQIEATAKEVIRLTASALPTQPQVPTLQNSPTSPAIRTAAPTATITGTPTMTGTVTLTPTPTAPARAFIAGDTNCRTGPSNHYDHETVISVGETVNVVGKARDTDYWLVENPDGEGTCWIWGGYATLEGSIDQVRHASIPRTKTPTKTPTSTSAPRAYLYLDEVILCSGQETLVIKVYNSGRVNLRSYRIVIYALPGRIKINTDSSNQFSHDDQECVRSISVLEPYRTGYALATFNPGGAVEFTADVQVCVDAGSRGGCIHDYFDFDIYLLTATPTYTLTPTRTPTPTPTPTNTTTLTPTP